MSWASTLNSPVLVTTMGPVALMKSPRSMSFFQTALYQPSGRSSRRTMTWMLPVPSSRSAKLILPMTRMRFNRPATETWMSPAAPAS